MNKETIELLEKNFVKSELCSHLYHMGFREKCVGYWREISWGQEKSFIHGIVDESLYSMITIPEDFDYLAPTWNEIFQWFEKKYKLVSWLSPVLSSENKVHYYIIRKGKPLVVFRSDDENDYEYMRVKLLERLIKVATNEDEAIKLL